MESITVTVPKEHKEELFDEIWKLRNTVCMHRKVEAALIDHPNISVLRSIDDRRVWMYLSDPKELSHISMLLAKALDVEFRSHQHTWEKSSMRMVSEEGGVKIQIDGGYLDACVVHELEVEVPEKVTPAHVKKERILDCPDGMYVIGSHGQWKRKTTVKELESEMIS